MFCDLGGGDTDGEVEMVGDGVYGERAPCGKEGGRGGGCVGPAGEEDVCAVVFGGGAAVVENPVQTALVLRHDMGGWGWLAY